MKRNSWLAICSAAVLVVSAQAPVSAETFKIDTSHSEVMFKVRHLGISNVKGNFGTFEGTFTYDPGTVADSVVSATIDVASIDTSNEDRDAHLRTADFFDVEKYPKMTFQSTKVVPGDTTEKFTVIGDLTLHGVTKEVTLDVEVGGVVSDPWGNKRAGFTATTTIDRQEFGLSFSKTLETGQLLIGNDVTITLEIEGVEEKE
jgi:polyisoprenoid-binding protein YceI